MSRSSRRRQCQRDTLAPRPEELSKGSQWYDSWSLDAVVMDVVAAVMRAKTSQRQRRVM